MPLLNKRLLQRNLNKHRHEVASQKRQELKTLFKETLERIDQKKFKKEESEKVPFLQKMFELLGYKLHENLEFEFSTQGRSIDAVLGEFNVAEGLSLHNKQTGDIKSPLQLPQVAIEWKGTNTTSLDKGKAGETPVSQMWDYMGKVGAEIGIVGNFLEWRLYTLQTKQSEYHEFNLRNLTQNEDKLDELIFLLRKSTLLREDKKHSFLQDLINQSEAEQEQITKQFYNDYKQRRTNLFEHLIQNNPEKDKHLLLEKTQKILDRLIFIMFCEDGYLLPSGTLKKVYETARNSFGGETKVWEQFKGLFSAIDKGSEFPKINAFNGGLFSEDLELNSLVIKDEIWADLIKLAEYDFESDLNVNILGHIFEQSIADIEEIKEEIDVAEAPSLHDENNGKQGPSSTKPKPKTSKRKKDGIYYTPEYITDYIVSETVESWLNDNQSVESATLPTPDATQQALEKITILDPAGGSGAFPNQVHNYLTKKWVEKMNQIALDSNLEALADFDEISIDKSILKNNIFMVDLQPESVEIAKLSLWLKTARKDQKLNNLDKNVKCGNSLISDPEIAGGTAFDWEKEFPEVMTSGGFDVIVGNPPWVQFKENQEFYKKHYQVASSGDLYALFIEKGISLLKQGGYLGFIVPSLFIKNIRYESLRKFILENTRIIEIKEKGDKVFEDVQMPSAIIILKKEKVENQNWSDFLPGADLIKKIEKNKTTVSDITTIMRGLEIGKDKLSDSKDYKILAGQDIARYSIENTSYISKEVFEQYKKHSEYFKGNRIYIRETGERITATFLTDNETFCVRSIYSIKSKNNTNLKFLLGVLNSQIIQDYYTYKYKADTNIFPKIRIGQVKSIPIPTATPAEQAQIAQLVDEIMDLKKANQTLTESLLKLTKAKYKVNQTTTKLKKWHTLETADFLDEINKAIKKSVAEAPSLHGKQRLSSTQQKLTLSQEAELITYFEGEKAKVEQLQGRIDKVDGEIEGLVRGLYGV